MSETNILDQAAETVAEQENPEAAALGVKSIRFFPMPDVRRRWGRRADELRAAAVAAIGRAGRGIELHYMKFEHGGEHYALASRIDHKKKSLDIEVDVISAGMSSVIITAEEARVAELAARSQRHEARGPRSEIAA